MIGDRLTPAEVAEWLRCSTRRVRILCATHELGHEYDGRRYWITEAQIEAYRRKCQRRAAA